MRYHWTAAWLALVICFIALAAYAASTSKNVAISVTHQIVGGGCLSDSFCPPPPAGMQWVLDLNADFTKGSMPAPFVFHDEGVIIPGGAPQNCFTTGTFARFTTAGLVLQPPPDATSACEIGTVGPHCGVSAGCPGNVTFGVGLFEVKSQTDSGTDDLDWTVSNIDTQCQPFSTGWEDDIVGGDGEGKFWDGYGTQPHPECFDHVQNPNPTYCLGAPCVQSYWWQANADVIRYADGALTWDFAPPGGAGDNTTNPGNVLISVDACFSPNCGSGVGHTIVWWRHYHLQ